jgi:hypothetical protein
VDDERAVVEQDPFSRFASLDAERPEARRLERRFDGLGDGDVLAGRGPVGDDEKVGERGELTQVEDTELFGFPAQPGLDGQPDVRGKASLSEPFLLFFCLGSYRPGLF